MDSIDSEIKQMIDYTDNLSKLKKLHEEGMLLDELIKEIEEEKNLSQNQGFANNNYIGNSNNLHPGQNKYFSLDKYIFTDVEFIKAIVNESPTFKERFLEESLKSHKFFFKPFSYELKDRWEKLYTIYSEMKNLESLLAERSQRKANDSKI